MYKHTVVFDDQLAKKITRKAKQKKLTKAAYIRHLVTLGLVQENSSKEQDTTKADVPKREKIMLTAVLETTYLCRSMMSHENTNESYRKTQLSQSRDRALETAERLLREEKEDFLS